jgi:hypothetical protein
MLGAREKEQGVIDGRHCSGNVFALGWVDPVGV